MSSLILVGAKLAGYIVWAIGYGIYKGICS